MEFRRITQLALLCSAICSYSLAQVTPGTGYLFQFPAPGSSSTRILGYLADTSDLNADLDVTGPAGPQRIIATPDGQRVYVLSANALQVFNASLQTMQPVTGIIGPIRNVTLTPDGKYLMVAATQFYIISTNTNSIVSTNLGASGAIADIAVSSDSRTAWILRSSNFFNSITPLNLVNLTAGTSVTIPRQGETITLSPQGKLYVPSRNSILEIDASTLAILSESFMSALPGRLHFNQEGTEAYFLDQDTQTSQGYSILSYRPNGQQVSGWPADVFDPNRPKFSELLFAGNNRIFGFDRAHTTLWEITTQPLGAAPVNMSTAFDSSIVFAAAVSNEFPSARYLYVLTENSARPTLERVNLSNGTLQTFANALVPTGALQYVGIPPQSGASQIIKHNDGQVLAHGGTAKTLYAYVTDSLGRAVYNQTVSFTLDAASSAATLRIAVRSPTPKATSAPQPPSLTSPELTTSS